MTNRKIKKYINKQCIFNKNYKINNGINEKLQTKSFVANIIFIEYILFIYVSLYFSVGHIIFLIFFIREFFIVFFQCLI